MADPKPKSEDESLAPKMVRADTGKPSKGLAVAPEMKKPVQAAPEDIEAPQIATEPPVAPDLGKPALPESVLGTEVPPGQQIPPEKMGQAEHLAADPHAEEMFRGKQEFHDTMRGFGEREAGNRASMVSLDPNDPDYLKKLAAHQAQEGMLREQKAHYQQSHPWGSMVSEHPGIGGKIGHAFGVMGNIAGNALIPGLMPSIPGTQANLQAKAAGGAAEQAQGTKQGLEAAQAESLENKEPKEANPEQQAFDAQQRIGTPQEQPGDKGLVEAYQKTQEIKQGAKPTEKPIGDTGVQQYVDQLKQIPTASPEEQQKFVDAFKPRPNDTPAMAAKRIEDAKGVAALAAGERNRELSRKIAENNHNEAMANFSLTKRMQGQEQMIKTGINPLTGERLSRENAPGEQPVDTHGSPIPTSLLSKLTPTTNARNMAEYATALLGHQREIDAEIDRLDKEGKLGPLAGRWNSFLVNEWGDGVPEYAKLRSLLGLEATGGVKAHMGARGAVQLVEKFESYFNPKYMTADTMKAGLDGMMSFMSGYKDMGAIHTVNDIATGRWIPPDLDESGSKGAPGRAAGGKPLSMAAIQQAAKDHGVSVDEAKRQAQAAGYTVQ